MKLTPFDFHTAFLSKDEFDNPFLVFDEFYQHDWPSGWREDIWEIFSAAMSGPNWEHDEPLDKGNHMYRFMMILKLMDASLRMHQLKVTNQFVLFATTLQLEELKQEKV